MLAPRLIDEWLAGGEAVPVIDEASVSLVRGEVRARGAAAGLPALIIDSLVIVASELAHNQLAHARLGAVAVRPIERLGVPGVEVVAADQGPGLGDPARALAGLGRAPDERGGSLGIGLSGAQRLADELDFDIRLGEGTCVWARKFAAPPGRRSEVALLGQAAPGMDLSGDHGAFVRTADHLLVGLADGLGKGAPAAEASHLAMACMRRHAGESPEQILLHADAALQDTRGAVLAVARAGLAGGPLVHAGAGDITTLLCRPGEGRRLHSAARVVGRGQGRPRPIVPEAVPTQPGDLLVLHSDGLLTRTAVPDELIRRRPHPVVVAQHLLTSYLRGHDDALVLVARL